MNENNRQQVLEVSDLKIDFSMYGKGLQKKSLRVIQSLSLSVNSGEILAVVGSSGSGKSLLAHAILGILPGNATVSGSIKYKGKELTHADQEKYRGKEIVFIPQSVDYLDPLMRIDKQVIGVSGSREKQRKLFEKYDLGKETEKMYPFQLSGGMARRVLISTAVMEEPKLIVADEPTPGLSVELAMETLAHFRKLADSGVAILLITHDIDLALNVADRIAVFYAGTTVEISKAEDFRTGKNALRHPYSKAFIDALPQNSFEPIDGAQPYAGHLPEGCLFADRCPDKTDECLGEIKMRSLRDGEVRCIHAT
jgi:peptide/nickel transport system ATP-binding protein